MDSCCCLLCLQVGLGIELIALHLTTAATCFLELENSLSNKSMKGYEALYSGNLTPNLPERLPLSELRRIF